MSTGLQVLIAIYIMLNIAAAFAILPWALYEYQTDKPWKSLNHRCYLLPWGLHAVTKMNWFGSWITSMVFLALIPVFYSAHLIYYIFHVGRKA